MNLGLLGRLLFEGDLGRLKKELSRMPLDYSDVPLVKSLLAALETNDELSLFYKAAQEGHEVPKEQRVRELLERLEESAKLAEALGGETDAFVASFSKRLIELLGAPVGFRFPSERWSF